MPRLPTNRSVYINSEAILRRLRSAKRPDIIVPLEIPPEEMDVEPNHDDPLVQPAHAKQIVTMPPIDELNSLPLVEVKIMRLSAEEIVPDDHDD